MKDFAPDSYYAEIIAKAEALGYRFVAKVQITTEDAEYHVPVTSARATCITFDVKGSAVFFNMYHHEHTGFMGDGYANHWAFKNNYDFGDHKHRLAKIEEKYQDRRRELNDIFEPFDNALARPIKNTTLGWSSRNCSQWTFTGEIEFEDDTVLLPVSLIESVLQDLHDDLVYYAADKFEELMMLWPPAYVFAGGDRTACREDREQKLANLYWERFGAGRTIIREKVGRTY